MPDETRKPATRATWARYGVAVLTVLLGWLAREALNSSVGNQHLPFVFFYPAVAISAWYGGLGPGVLATLLSVGLADLYILGRAHTFRDHNQYEIFALGGYLLSCGFIVGAIGQMHGAQR